jgi:hypothetical protein
MVKAVPQCTAKRLHVLAWRRITGLVTHDELYSFRCGPSKSRFARLSIRKSASPLYAHDEGLYNAVKKDLGWVKWLGDN